MHVSWRWAGGMAGVMGGSGFAPSASSELGLGSSGSRHTVAFRAGPALYVVATKSCPTRRREGAREGAGVSKPACAPVWGGEEGAHRLGRVRCHRLNLVLVQVHCCAVDLVVFLVVAQETDLASGRAKGMRPLGTLGWRRAGGSGARARGVRLPASDRLPVAGCHPRTSFVPRALHVPAKKLCWSSSAACATRQRAWLLIR